MDAFTGGHYALLEGSAWLGNGMVPDVCLLAQTAYVTYQYEERVLPELRKVIYRLRITEEDWEYLGSQINTLLVAVEGNYHLITTVEGKACPNGGCGGRWNRAMECPQVRAAIDDNAWLSAVSMLNNNRRVLQEVTRVYLQIVMGYDTVGRIDRLKLRRETFLTTMNRIIQGYTADNVPSPPTQDLSETLQSFLFSGWRPVDEIFRQAVQAKTKTFDGRLEGADNTTILLLDKRCTLLENRFLEISSLYIRECPPHLRERCFMVEASYNQATAYERMVKEAWFCSLFENSTAFLQRFNYTKDNLTAATIRLVDGVLINDEVVKKEHEFWSFKVRRQISSLRSDADTSKHKDNFAKAWKYMAGTEAEKTAALQTCYITLNTLPDKSAWEPPSHTTATPPVAISECQGQYHDYHRSYYSYWRTLLQMNGYGDLFLFDLNANLVYSVKKNGDFGMNFDTGAYTPTGGTAILLKDTGLGQTLKATLERPKEVHESSWAIYPPNGANDNVAFMCSGIPGAGEDVFVGVICIELPAEKGLNIPRTQSYCILNELYLVRKYEAQLIDLAENVVYKKNWTEYQLARFTGAYFGDLAPQFVKVGDYYSQANPTCVASKWLEYASIEQWRVGMSTASMLPSILPMVAKQYFVANKMDSSFEGRPAILYSKGLKAKLAGMSLTLGDNYLRDLRLGTLDGKLPAAPAQLIVDRDLASLDAWSHFTTVIQQVYREQDVIPIGNIVYEAIITFRRLVEAFTTYARRSAHSIDEVEPNLMEKTGDPAIYIQQMAMEASMLSLWQGSPANLTRSVSAFEAVMNDLKTDQRTANERCRVQAVAQVVDAWEPFKPEIELFGIKFTYSEKQIVDMMNGTEDLYKAAAYMQTMFEEVSPTCEFTDSGSIRSTVGLVAVLHGIATLLRLLA
jgi:hypothetical protein